MCACPRLRRYKLVVSLAGYLALTLTAPIERAWSLTAPSITSESATNVVAPNATLTAQINPNGLNTTCVFQYVDDAAFQKTQYSKAKSVACSPSDSTHPLNPQTWSAIASGLTAGTTYHFRAVATNADGTVDGTDITFPEVKVEAVVHVGPMLTNANNFSLALDAADYVYVGDANTSNVVRIAPRGDVELKNAQGTDVPGGAPCVTVILSAPMGVVEGQPSSTPCMLPPDSPPGFPFGGPKGIAISSDGSVYVVGTGGSTNLCDNVVGIFPDGEIVELVNRNELGSNGQGMKDWNPAGLAIDEDGASGVFVYATGPAPNGATVRINPDRTFQQILNAGGQGLVVDADTGNVYLALTSDSQVLEIPDARSGVCGVNGKDCPSFIIGGPTTTTTPGATTTTTTTVPGITTTTTTIPSPAAQAAASGTVTVGCDGRPVTLVGTYGLALAGGILYVTGQDSNNVLRVPLQPDNALGLPLCVEEIFADGTDGLTLKEPRAIAADSSGNVYVAGALSNNVIWIRPAPADKTQVIPQEIINFADSGLNKPEAVAVDSQGNVYVSGNLDGVGTPNVFRIKTVTADLNPLCGNGSLDKGEVCDYSLDCCCSLNCGIQTERTVCRGSSGQLCDVNDVCDGTSPTCADQFQAAGVECHTPAGGCDLASYCTGTGRACPAAPVRPAGTVCGRPAVNACDVADMCDGSSPLCPIGQHQPCPPPLLAEGVQDPCRENDCVQDTTGPGSHCLTRKLSCDGCQADPDCNPTSCQQASCELATRTCTYVDYRDIASEFRNYTCAFSCLSFQMCPDKPRRAIDRTLLKIFRRHNRAIKLTNEARMRCSDAKGSEARLRSAVEELETALVQIVVLGFGHGDLSQCVDDVSQQLEQRASRIRDQLTLKEVQQRCVGAAVASELPNCPTPMSLSPNRSPKQPRSR
jgi:hypothetical protein